MNIQQDNKNTIIFQNNIWSVIWTICPSLETNRECDQYDRSALQGTVQEWMLVSKSLREMRNTANSSEKRSLTAAIKNIEIQNGFGEYYEKHQKELDQKYAVFLARRAARNV